MPRKSSRSSSPSRAGSIRVLKNGARARVMANGQLRFISGASAAYMAKIRRGKRSRKSSMRGGYQQMQQGGYQQMQQGGYQQMQQGGYRRRRRSMRGGGCGMQTAGGRRHLVRYPGSGGIATAMRMEARSPVLLKTFRAAYPTHQARLRHLSYRAKHHAAHPAQLRYRSVRRALSPKLLRRRSIWGFDDAQNPWLMKRIKRQRQRGGCGQMSGW